jgi:hypothetical protein
VLDEDPRDTILTLTNFTIALGGGFFSGQIADLLFWTRPLTSKEILDYSTGFNILKLYSLTLINWQNKLECWPLAPFSQF